MAVAIADLHTTAWHDARRSGVGGSDIPILAGLSPYRNLGIHDLYLLKTGQLEPSPSTPAMEVGQVIEDAIAILYARRTGKAVVRANQLARHPDHAWAIGNIDRKVRGERRLLEIKNRRSSTRELPADIECQVQWYMGVTRYPVADVAILVSGSDLRIVEVTADEAYFQDLVVIAGDFWRRVVAGDPPDIDGSASAARYLAAKYPWHQGDDLAPADADIEHLAQQYRAGKEIASGGVSIMAAAENAIKALLGESPGVQGDGWRITWKRSADYHKTDWASAVKSYVDEDPMRLVAFEPHTQKHTRVVEGSRRFVPTFDLRPEGEEPAA